MNLSKKWKNLLKKWHEKPLSWSQLNAYKYDKEAWYKRYFLGEEAESSHALSFGKKIGEQLASDPTFLPEVLRYDVMEKEFKAPLDNFSLIGFLDTYNSKNHYFHEYKTSANKTRWTHQSANEHGQMLFYLSLIYLNHSVPPEKIKMKLFYIPVHTRGDFQMEICDKVQSFEVKHTTLEMVEFLADVIKTRREMEEFIHRKILAEKARKE